MRILLFTEGTILMHSSAQQASREERVKQVLNNEFSVKDFANYVPIFQSNKKLKTWVNAGAEIYYLTSRTGDQVDKISIVLKKYNFPNPENLAYRVDKEEYSDLVKRIQPTILIEDDCESIGGQSEMVSPTLPNGIRIIVLKEFAGIDSLPDVPDMMLV